MYMNALTGKKHYRPPLSFLFPPPQHRPGCSSGSGSERGPRGRQQPAAGQRGQGCGSAEEPEHRSHWNHVQRWQRRGQRETGSDGKTDRDTLWVSKCDFVQIQIRYSRHEDMSDPMQRCEVST